MKSKEEKYQWDIGRKIMWFLIGFFILSMLLFMLFVFIERGRIEEQEKQAEMQRVKVLKYPEGPKDFIKSVREYPNVTKIMESKSREAILSMNQKNVNLIEKLTQKAVGLLSENEKEDLTSLQTRFLEGGYDALSDNEIKRMQQLNKKAFNLLPTEDRATLNKLLLKNIDRVRQGAEEQILSAGKLRLKELVDKLDDPDVALRWQAVVELEKLGSKAKDAVPDLILYLEHNDWRIRYYAAEILGTIGPGAKAAVPSLRKASNDTNRKVQYSVSDALNKILKNK